MLLEAAGEVPAAAGRPPSCALRTGFESLRVIGFTNRPYDGVRGVGGAAGFVVGEPRSAFLWIPASSGTTMGVFGPARAVGGGG